MSKLTQNHKFQPGDLIISTDRWGTNDGNSKKKILGIICEVKQYASWLRDNQSLLIQWYRYNFNSEVKNKYQQLILSGYVIDDINNNLFNYYQAKKESLS